MSFLFVCPHCQARTMVDDQYAGQSGKCAVCGKDIQLPASINKSAGISNLPKSPSNVAVRWIVAAVIAVALVGTLGFMALRYGSQGMQTMQANRLRGQCIVNLEKIAKALQAYSRDYGTYPPPYTVAADGTTPMHSWRVLILPYLNEIDLYDRFNLEEPWSSPANQLLAYEMPKVYASPATSNRAFGVASYYLVTGTGTLFPASGPLAPDDVVDDPGKTLLLVETATPPAAINQWIQPGDFDLGNTSMTIGQGLGGSHEGGMTVVTVNGTGHWIRASVDPAVLKALITPAGGEGIGNNVLE